MRDGRRALIGWAAGIGLYILTIASFYPSIARQAETFKSLLDKYPKGLLAAFGMSAGLDLTSGVGFLGGELFGFILPMLFLIVAVSHGTAALAREEENGTLDLLLANPVTRRRLVVEKYLAGAGEIAALGVFAWLVAWGSAAAFGMGVSGVRLGEAMLSVTLLALLFCALALMCGGLTGRRSVAAAATATVAVAGYALTTFAVLVPGLRPWRWLSPLTYARAADVLRLGLSLSDVVVLVVLTVVLVGAAAVVFDRRDLSL